MAVSSVKSPFQQFFDLDGKPLNGNLYIGLANQDPRTNPIAVYWDENSLLQAAQPIKIVSGYPSRNGSPAIVYVNNSHSMRVENNQGKQVFYSAELLNGVIGQLDAGSIIYPAYTNRTVEDELDDLFVSVKRFGVLGNGTDEYNKIKDAWDYCLAYGKSLYFPEGIYDTGEQNFPFKNPNFPAASLLDCKDITILGAGPNTILRTSSSLGADVINCYSVKNLHFRNLKVKANLSGTSGSGSNGISIVGGFDNLTFDGIWVENLPYVDKGTYLDGGKAFTIQPGTPATECGTVKAKIYAKGCVHGSGLEVDLVNWASKKHSIEVDIVAEDCHNGVLFSAAGASGALSDGMNSGYRVKAQLINCQRSVILGRAHGVDINANIITTKTAAARRLNPLGSAWSSSDTTVDGLWSVYAKNSKIEIIGDMGGCDYKAQIGGASQGLSGLNGATENCDIYLDIGGTAATSAINAVDFGGNTLANSRLTVTNSTGTIPADFFTGSKSNDLTVLGQYTKLQALRFPVNQISSSDPNTLDDYEEGAFTPILADTNLVPEGATYSLSAGFYTKIGNMVNFNLYIGLSSLGALTGADQAFIIGLPYQSRLVSGNLSSCNIGFASGLSLSAGEVPTARIGSGEQYITLSKWTPGGTSGVSAMTVSNVSASGILVISGSYRTAT